MSNINTRTPTLQETISRSYIRGLLCMIFIAYNLFSYGQMQQNMAKYRKVSNDLEILKQMQEYATEHCSKYNENIGNAKYVETMKQIRKSKRTNVSKDRVNEDVTFILLGPTLDCLIPAITWFHDHFKEAKALIALDLGISTFKTAYVPDDKEQKMQFLGGFTNIAEALNHAIPLVDTPYFMLIDHEMDLINMQDDFMVHLLRNIPGLDVLSGTFVDVNGELLIPCHRVKMKYWSYYEIFQYNLSRHNPGVLQCDMTSVPFMGRTEIFEKIRATSYSIFDFKLPSKWLQDFFIRFRKLLKIGLLPEIIMRRNNSHNCFKIENQALSRMDKADMLLPFAKKHQLFYITSGRTMFDVCNESSSLSCSEEKMQRDWNLPHWMNAGFTTYPFIIASLEKALYFGTEQLEKEGLMYVIEGGTLLGLVKLRSILPWDHGDIDTFVYATRRQVINMVKKSYRDYGYTFWIRHTGFHTYVSEDPNSLNGCFVYLTRRVKPKAIVYLRHKGRLFPVRRDLMGFLRKFYDSTFLENRMKFSNGRNRCFSRGHHACVRDCRWDGCGRGLG